MCYFVAVNFCHVLIVSLTLRGTDYVLQISSIVVAKSTKASVKLVYTEWAKMNGASVVFGCYL